MMARTIILESITKIQRKEGATGNIEAGETVSVKEKNRFWKAVRGKGVEE